VEPYAGGLSVLLAKDPEGTSEVVNDTSFRLTNFWRVLQDPGLWLKFQHRVSMTPFSEIEWNNALEIPSGVYSDYVAAAMFFVRCRQSMAGRMKNFAPLTKSRLRRGMNEQVSAWLGAVEGLQAVHERLMRVVIENRDALDVIRQMDTPDTVFYCDPPYLHETRATVGEYDHEMTDQQHMDLLELLSVIEGKFLLSGYFSRLYDDFARECGWHMVAFELPNNSAGGAVKRRMTECVWTNFDPGG
jgi:DNA adenine methylase